MNCYKYEHGKICIINSQYNLFNDELKVYLE